MGRFSLSSAKKFITRTIEVADESGETKPQIVKFYAIPTTSLLRFRSIARHMMTAWADLTSIGEVRRVKSEKVESGGQTMTTTDVEPASVDVLRFGLDRKNGAIQAVFEKLVSDDSILEVCRMIAHSMRDEAKNEGERETLAAELATMPPKDLLVFASGALEAMGINFAPFQNLARMASLRVKASLFNEMPEEPDGGKTRSSGTTSPKEQSEPSEPDSLPT
jgi:hypothetical protein